MKITTSIMFSVLIIVITLMPALCFFHGIRVGRETAEREMFLKGYDLGFNQGVSMTEIPGAEIIDLTNGTKTIVPTKD